MYQRLGYYVLLPLPPPPPRQHAWYEAALILSTTLYSIA